MLMTKKERIKKYNITLDIPSTYTTDYNNLVDDYVSTIYVEAMDLLEQENFSESEKLLKEVACSSLTSKMLTSKM